MSQDKNEYADHSRIEMIQFLNENISTLLDVGCHMGGFGAAVKQIRTTEVWGIEPNKATAQKSAERLDVVINDTYHDKIDIPDNYFDAIFFNDVLEHMVDPWAALEFSKSKLTTGGCIVVSLPKMLHIDNLLHLITKKDFCYEEWGIRDKTHLRFFTRISARRMFKACGYVVETEKGMQEDWWSPSLLRRLLFRLFSKKLEETKYIQNAYVLRLAR